VSGLIRQRYVSELLAPSAKVGSMIRNHSSGMAPVESTSFFGRDGEIRGAAAFLLGGARLLTLVGMAGVGKTRLAMRVVRTLQRAAPRQAVRWVSLAGLGSSERRAAIERRIAESIGAELRTANSTGDVLLERLHEEAGSAGLLLVLDDCEHVLEQVGAVVSAVLAGVPGVQLLTTSREPLGCAGEHLQPVRPLPCPPSGTTWTDRYAAVDLLFDRAGTTIGPADRMAAAQLCRQLDGIPLAIELAAVGLRSQTLPELVERFSGGPDDARFQLLTGGPRHGAHPLHHSLRAAMEGSHQLCTEQQQTMWARASVLEDGWDMAAAEAVCSGGDIAPEDVLRLVMQLTDKSIITADTSGPRTRYRMLRTVQLYGRSLAGLAGDEMRRRHRDHYLDLATQGSSTRARAELPNIRAAVNWSLATPGEIGTGLELAVHLAGQWVHLRIGNTGEMLEWLQEGLTAASDTTPAQRASAVALAGVTALLDGSIDVARDLLAQCRAETDPADSTSVLFEGMHSFLIDDDPRCVALLDRASTAAGPAAESNVGFAAMAAAWYGTRDDAFTAARGLQDNAGGAGTTTWAMLIRGTARIRHGDPGSALMELQRHGEIHGNWEMTYATHMAAWATAEQVAASTNAADNELTRIDLHRQARRVVRLLGAARHLQDRSGTSYSGLAPFERADARATAVAEAVLGATATGAAFDEGRHLSFDDIVALTLHRPARPARDLDADQDTRWQHLTPAQKVIALLAAEGLSDVAIAHRRVCSVRTVEKHMEVVRQKLLIGSRTEIDRWIPAEHRSA
jgi:predicted ATPase/DNA-binding CsgD family transcriptional regulator